jgi:hypothetical protein
VAHTFLAGSENPGASSMCAHYFAAIVRVSEREREKKKEKARAFAWRRAAMLLLQPSRRALSKLHISVNILYVGSVAQLVCGLLTEMFSSISSLFIY